MLVFSFPHPLLLHLGLRLLGEEEDRERGGKRRRRVTPKLAEKKKGRREHPQRGRKCRVQEEGPKRSVEGGERKILFESGITAL